LHLTLETGWAFVMDEQIKKNLDKLARDAEMKVARSILRWKYKRDGKPAPLDNQLENESIQAAGRARQIIVTRGKNVWNELKKVYIKNDVKKGDSSK